MHNYFQKFCLILIFLCMAPRVYTMESFLLFCQEFLEDYGQARANFKLSQAVLLARKNKFTDLKMIKKYIAQGANPNSMFNGNTLAGLAVQHSNKGLLQYLIQHNADINKKDGYNCAPLKYAMTAQHTRDVDGRKKNLEIIQVLCDAGASLIYDDSTVFYYVTTIGEPHEKIEAILTHARFDCYNQNEDEQLKEKVILFLCASKQVGLPIELQFYILSKIPLNFYGFNKRLCRKLSEKGYTNSFLTYIEKRIKTFDTILHMPDKNGITSSAEGLNLFNKSKQIQRLFNGSRLDDDMVRFKELFPKNTKEIPEDNLVLKMYNA